MSRRQTAGPGQPETVEARVLVNAAGPWVELLATRLVPHQSHTQTRLVRGAHIVVPRLFDHDRAYILQNEDERIVFAIPYQNSFTLIGTTDCDHTGSLDEVRATPGEIAYLCKSVSSYFRRTVQPVDVVWSFAGVRSLLDDGAKAAQAATRDYRLRIDADGEAPILSVLGGKITTYRRLAEEALALLARHLPDFRKRSWTGTSPLPGGDFPMDGFSRLLAVTTEQYPGVDGSLIERLLRAYGTRAARILGQARTAGDLGENFGAGLHEAEVRYLMREEWAESAADVLWRRSKLGLFMSAEEILRLEAWMARAQAAEVISARADEDAGASGAS